MARNLLSYETDVKSAPDKLHDDDLGAELILNDGDGLQLLITRSGRYWRFRYSLNGVRIVCWMNGDPVERIATETTAKNELAEARRWAAWCRMQKAAKLDIRQVRAEREDAIQLARKEVAQTLAKIEAEKARRLTMNDLYARWDSTHGLTIDPHSRLVRRSHWHCYLGPAIGGVLIEEASKNAVMAAYDAAVANGKANTARDALGLLVQLIKWGVERGLVAEDHKLRLFKKPARKTKISEDQRPENFNANDFIAKHGDEVIGQDGEEGKAGRALQFCELTELLQKKLPESAQAMTGKCIVRYMLATGVRASQAVKLRWDWVSMERRMVIYPTGSMKKHKMHHVHLSDFAFQQLLQMQSIRTNDFVFPAPIKAVSHVLRSNVSTDITTRQHYADEDLAKRMTKSRARSQYNLYNLSGGRWTLYDLRRTTATRLMELTGADWDVVKRVLAHSQKAQHGETDKYVRFSRWEERCAALDQWGAALAECESGVVPNHIANNVLALKRA